MKKTSLYETHQAAGATLVPFAGWDMPVSYAGTVSEVAAVRTSAGIFDVSHMGEVTVIGSGAFDFVQSVTTNDVSKLVPGKAQYSLLLNEGGGIIDDIIVYCQGENDYLIVLNAGCKDVDWAWLQAQAEGKPNVILTDISDQTALIAVQGPEAVKIVGSLAGYGHAEETNRFHSMKTDLGPRPWWHTGSALVKAYSVTLSRTGYTGEDGFEIFCHWKEAPYIWKILTEAGAVPAGLGARDVLRLEAAYPLYGHELDDVNSPASSGTGWAVKMKKGDFIGRTALQGKVQSQQLVGLQMDARAIPREHYTVYNAEGHEIGETTSGTWSPTVKAGIAMARVDLSAAVIGTPVFVDIRGRQASAKVTKLPFYRNGV
ncbi:MAG: glycine cleavage system aminomethyltransferase GcvT [Janthinobacterium lividum]